MSGDRRLCGVRTIALTAFLALLCAVLAACGAGAPSGPADITGQVTRSTAGPNSVVVLVEENPLDTSGSAKASVTVDSRTRLLRQTDTGEIAVDRGELRSGLRVSVWFEGPVAESYPVQGKAGTLVILR